MEEITWFIYKTLTKELTKEINPKLFWKITNHFLFVALFFAIGWTLQNQFEINVNEDTQELFGVIVQLLVSLVAFVGVMVVFGLNGIRNKPVEKLDQLKEESEKEIKETKKDVESDIEGWKLGRTEFLKFGVYSFFIVVLNLFFVVFSLPQNTFTLAILFVDIALVIRSFRLVIGLAGRILDIDKKLLRRFEEIKFLCSKIF